MYSPYPHQSQGGAPQPAHHASLPAYNPNMNTAAGLAQAPNHHQPQPQHHMMYNPQQYAHQSPYGVGNPIMTGMPQMHNGGMAQHSGGNSNVPHYQTPYTSSPYGSSIPTSTAGPGHPQAYQASFAMNMQQQQQQPQQRMMQPPPPSSTPNSHSSGPSRASPYPPPAMPHQMTPPNASNPQFAPHPSQVHQQNLQGQQQQQNLHQSNQSVSQNAAGNQNHGGQNQQMTPSTPTNLPPLSPGSEAREKERVGLLLDINRDLLMEVMRLQALQTEIKKEMEGDPNPESKAAERKGQAHKDFLECMRRLQYNLAYLAAIADRHHKPSAQIPHHPVLMFAPPLSQSATTFNFSSPMMTNATPPKFEHPNSPDNPPAASKVEGDIQIEKESRINSLRENYKKLQDSFGLTEAECRKENQEMQAKGRMQAQQQQQMYQQNQQHSPLSGGGQQRPPSQQMSSNQHNMGNMGMPMQGQGQQQQMNLAMNSAMGIPSMAQNPMGGGGGMAMPSQVDMGFQRGLPGGGMPR